MEAHDAVDRWSVVIERIDVFPRSPRPIRSQGRQERRRARRPPKEGHARPTQAADCSRGMFFKTPETLKKEGITHAMRFVQYANGKLTWNQRTMVASTNHALIISPDRRHVYSWMVTLNVGAPLMVDFAAHGASRSAGSAGRAGPPRLWTGYETHAFHQTYPRFDSVRRCHPLSRADRRGRGLLRWVRHRAHAP